MADCGIYMSSTQYLYIFIIISQIEAISRQDIKKKIKIMKCGFYSDH